MKSNNHALNMHSDLKQDFALRDSYRLLKEKCLQNMLLISLGIGFFAFILFAIISAQDNYRRIMVPAIAIISLFIITLFRDLQFSIRAGVFIGQLFIIGTAALFSIDYAIHGVLLLLTSALTTFVLFNEKYGLISSIISIFALILHFLIPTQGFASISTSPMLQTPMIYWTLTLIVFVLCLYNVGYPTYFLFGKLDKEYNKQLSLISSLSTTNERLEKQTLDFQKRAFSLEAVLRINRQIGLAKNITVLIDRQLQLITDHFQLHSCHLAIWNSEQELFTNQLDLQRNNLLDVFLEALARQEIRTIQRDENSVEYFSEEMLADSQSQLFIPVYYQTMPLGVLHLVGNQISTFSLDIVQQIQMIASQIADTIIKIRSKQDLENKLSLIENQQKSQTQASWIQHLQSTKKQYGYQFDGAKISIPEKVSSNAQQAISKGQILQTKIYAPNNPDQKYAIASIPIRLRDQVIGVLDFKFDTPEITTETLALLDAATERLSAALDNARLMEDVQARADRERIIAEISDKVRSQYDINSLLQTAAAEIGRTLGVSEVFVQLEQKD